MLIALHAMSAVVRHCSVMGVLLSYLDAAALDLADRRRSADACHGVLRPYLSLYAGLFPGCRPLAGHQGGPLAV